MEQVTTGVSNTLRTNLEATISYRQGLVLEQKRIAKLIDEATDAIKNEMLAQGLDTFDTGLFVSKMSVRERATLDKQALIDEGVSTDQIFKATKVSTFIQLDVREKKA
jgi:hypothetical protein